MKMEEDNIVIKIPNGSGHGGDSNKSQANGMNLNKIVGLMRPAGAGGTGKVGPELSNSSQGPDHCDENSAFGAVALDREEYIKTYNSWLLQKYAEQVEKRNESIEL